MLLPILIQVHGIPLEDLSICVQECHSLKNDLDLCALITTHLACSKSLSVLEWFINYRSATKGIAPLPNCSLKNEVRFN